MTTCLFITNTACFYCNEPFNFLF